MILLKKNTNWFHRITHGYFLLKKYLLDDFKKEIFLTIFDPKLNKSCYGYMYLTSKNVFISMVRDLSDISGIYKLEAGDKLLLTDDSFLEKTINSNLNGERYKTVSTANPISFINLNDRYLLLINIQSGKVYYPEILSGAYGVMYLTKKDYKTKINNLLSLINSILNNTNPDFSIPIHGLNPILSILNIYLGLFILLLAILLFFYFF